MKKFITSIVVIIFLILLGVMTFSKNSPRKIEGMEALKYEQLANLPIEEAYDYEEILKDMESNELATTEMVANFKTQHETNTKLTSTNSTGTVRYAKLAMNSHTFTKGFSKYELTPIFYVGLYYTSDTQPDKIISIAEPYMSTLGATKCVFDGNIFYKLENGHSFYYGISGAIYKKTKTFVKNIDFDGRYFSDSLSAD
ncbi:hypothetical protein SDC9_123659 [bioreactor metagenome]|uniref:Uncharacterized protein n=1 Tax=bioreactor metagenome TaxID=1076179 RepID=A0A645CIA7_9ZZZZ